MYLTSSRRLWAMVRLSLIVQRRTVRHLTWVSGLIASASLMLHVSSAKPTLQRKLDAHSAEDAEKELSECLFLASRLNEDGSVLLWPD